MSTATEATIPQHEPQSSEVDTKADEAATPRHDPLFGELATVAEIAEEFDVSPRTIQRWVRLRKLPPPVRIGRWVRLDRRKVRDRVARLGKTR